jgi:DUF1365 family protein
MESAFYRGVVSHNRWHPNRHGFAYEIFSAFLDIDVSCGPKLGNSCASSQPILGMLCSVLQNLDVLRTWWPLASLDRWSFAAFRQQDHLKGIRKPTQTLADAVRELVENETGSRPRGKIFILTNLAYFGYCFNPVSFYYIFREASSEIETVIAEVTNTPW